MSPQPIDEALHAAASTQARGIAEICEDLAVPFLDIFPAFSNFTHWREEVAAGDGAHPGAGGYEEFAGLVDAWPSWRALLDSLRE